MLEGEATIAKFTEVSQKYAKVVELKPDNYRALDAWSETLIHLFHLSKDRREATDFLDQATNTAMQEKQLSKKGNYNLACIHAIKGDAEAAVEELKLCLTDDTLPSPEHLDADDDLDSIRESQLYIQFRESLES